MKKVLTIAGSDCSGGAGIQADIKTITCHKMYAMSVVASLTAQNTMGVIAINDVPKEFAKQQMDAVFSDIIPDSVKIGMLSSCELIETISKKLVEYNAKNIVIDPVMVSTSGSKLLKDDAVNTLVSTLFPLGSIITPNIFEAQILCGFEIKNHDDMIRSAKVISKNIKGAILIKGGHLSDEAMDLLYENGEPIWFSAKRINNLNTHGTGCTLSSAIACGLAGGKTIKESVQDAKEYLTGAIRANLNLGKGNGPLNHMYNLS